MTEHYADPGFRVGRKNPRNIYRNAGTGNYEDDQHFAVALDPDDGELIATALSAFTAALDTAQRRLAGPQLRDAMKYAKGGSLASNPKIVWRVAEQAETYVNTAQQQALVDKLRANSEASSGRSLETSTVDMPPDESEQDIKPDTSPVEEK